MDDAERPGQRLKAARNARGWTQQQLADYAKVSKGMLAKVESGHATASKAWLGACARALDFDVDYLTGQPYAEGPEANTELHRVIPVIRRALNTWDLVDPDDDTPTRPLDELTAEVDRVSKLRRDTAYTRVAEVLPGLLSEIGRFAEVAKGEERTRAFALLSMCYRAANTLAHKLGYQDLSMLALDRMDRAAHLTEDPLMVATTDYLRAGALSRIGAWSEACRLLLKAMSRLEDDLTDDPNAMAVYGSLHMKAGIIYSLAADKENSREHMAEARQMATRIGSDIVAYETTFGPANVAIHEVSAEVELANPEQALTLASNVHIPDDIAKERSSHHYLDVARAHILNGTTDAAIEALYEARAIAPSHIRNHYLTRETLLSAAAQQRRSTTGLRSLANWVGIRD